VSYTQREVRNVVVAELSALVNEALSHENVDYTYACERLMDLVQRRALDLLWGAPLCPPTEPIQEDPCPPTSPSPPT
jgi:hypothetical protein